MSGMQLNTDFSTIEPNVGAGGGFPVSDPERGWLCQIVESGPKETKKKDGMRCVLVLQGLEGPVTNMKHEWGINVANPNQQSVTIGFGELSAIAHCVGVLRVGNTMELHGKPFRVIISQQKDDPKFTEVSGVRDANGNKPGKAGQGPMAPQPAAFQGQPAQMAPQGAPPAQGQPFAPQPAQQWAPPANQAPQGAPGGWGGAPAAQPAQGQTAPANWQPQGQPPANIQPQQGQWQPAQGQPAQGGGAPAWATTPAQ